MKAQERISWRKTEEDIDRALESMPLRDYVVIVSSLREGCITVLTWDSVGGRPDYAAIHNIAGYSPAYRKLFTILERNYYMDVDTEWGIWTKRRGIGRLGT